MHYVWECWLTAGFRSAGSAGKEERSCNSNHGERDLGMPSATCCRARGSVTDQKELERLQKTGGGSKYSSLPRVETGWRCEKRMNMACIFRAAPRSLKKISLIFPSSRFGSHFRSFLDMAGKEISRTNGQNYRRHHWTPSWPNP